MKLTYRPDIDGLRAIAVLSVLFFHTNIPGFSGGYVGVDIFFVISGYLITSILLNAIQEDSFSIAFFYERRIRRIFPALFPVIFFTVSVGAYLFDSDAFYHLGKSVIATTLFFSNILFLKESGYFDAPSLQKPLLHTWSLAVEEQFYIFFPLLLYIIHRYGKGNYLIWLLILLVLSLSGSIYGVYNAPSAAFYLVTHRAWELIAGSLFALQIIPKPKSTFGNNLLSICGFLLILASIFLYTETTPFPGVAAIVPILGTIMIIHSDSVLKPSVISRLLSIKPLVFIGLISYSLYLWHWPFVAFTKYYLTRPIDAFDKIFIILTSFALSIFSWKFIEKPFRGGDNVLPEQKKLFWIAGLTMLLTTGVGSIITGSEGLAGMAILYPKLNEMLKKASSGWDDEADYKKLLEKHQQNQKQRLLPQIIGDVSAKPTFLLWGDSHAYALKPGIALMAKNYHLSGYIANYTACPPVLDVDRLDTPENEASINEKAMTILRQNPSIKVVILSARWPWYYEGTGYKNAGNSFRMTGVNNLAGTNNRDLMINGLNETVRQLLAMKIKVILVNNFPEIGYGVPQLYSMHIRFPDSRNINSFIPTEKDYIQRQQAVTEHFNELSKLPGVTVIHPESMMFDDKGKCRIIADNELLYRDDNHLSVSGAIYVATVFRELFKTMQHL
jgi:peptidoglycan/LPS O-acetylase OafA/YrhL